MLLAVLALLAQQGVTPPPSPAPRPPTVGDTIVLIRRVTVNRPARIDAPPPLATGAIEPLEPPTVRVPPSPPSPAGDTVALITYRLVAWEAGALTVVLPPVRAVSADGRHTELAAETAVVRVASVLPADSAVEPAPPRPFIPLRSADAVPPVLAAAAGFLLIAGALLTGRRRRRERRRHAALGPPWLAGAGLWVAAGEARGLLDRASALLRRSPAGCFRGGRTPEWPRPGWAEGRETAVTQLLDELDRSRFAARVDPALALRLARDAERLLAPPVPGDARR